MRAKNLTLAAALASFVFTGDIFAATYTETGNGDLSGNKDAPTAFTLTAASGANTLTATTVAGDEDYVRVVVPAGHNLQSLFLTAYNDANKKSFIAFQAGSTFTETVAAPDPTKMDGYVHFGTSATAGGQLGTNIFPAMAAGIAGFGAPKGFTTPLPAGSYTFWLHETASGAGNERTYTLTFNVQALANVQAPILDPVTGSFFDSVQVSMTSATSGATIFYTDDGTDPTTSGTVKTYLSAQTLTQTTTIKAYAVKAGSNDSLVTTEIYTVTPTPATPTPTPVPAPTLTLKSGSSIKTTKPSVTIKGTSKNAVSVTYKVGSGATKKADGTSPWSFTTKVKPGKNVITVIAKGAKKNSAPKKVVVTYKKKK